MEEQHLDAILYPANQARPHTHEGGLERYGGEPGTCIESAATGLPQVTVPAGFIGGRYPARDFLPRPHVGRSAPAGDRRGLRTRDASSAAPGDGHGKSMIGWDEIAATRLLPTSIVQHWRPGTSPADAVERGTTVILSPGDRLYLDMKYDASTAIGLTWAGQIDVRKAYDWDPEALLEGVRGEAILGVEAPLWSETIANIREVEYLAFPRVAAVAEIGWSPRDRRAWDDFSQRLGAQALRWSALGVNFYRAPQVPWRH